MLVPRVSEQVHLFSFPPASPPLSSSLLFLWLWAHRALEASPSVPPDLLPLRYFDLISSSYKKDDICKISTKSRKKRNVNKLIRSANNSDILQKKKC